MRILLVYDPTYAPGSGPLIIVALGKQIYELEVLELGSQGGGELGPVLLIAKRTSYFEERGDGAT
jgi:hypothetical protein